MLIIVIIFFSFLIKMSLNVRASLVEFEDPVAPNWKSSNILTQKIYPVNSVIGAPLAGGSGGAMDGNLEFLWSVPAGYRMDVSRSYILFDTAIVNSTAGYVTPITAVINPAFNLPSTWFNTGRLELNDVLVSQSNNVPQDDTMFARMTNSYAKYTTNNSSALMFGSDAQRRTAVATQFRQQIAWMPCCLLNPEMVLPENVKCHIILQVNPVINNAPLNSPSFTAGTGFHAAVGLATAQGRCLFYGVHMVATYVKVETPTPNTVFIPAYNIKSTYQQATSTNNNLQYTIGKDVYKAVVALQSSSATLDTGAVATKFTAPNIANADGADQDANSALLTGIQLNFAGQNYPATMYNLLETATASKSADAYTDYLGAVSALQDPSGSESIYVWKDPKTVDSVAFGRLFAFNVVRPSNDMSSTAELQVNFSAQPANTRVFLWGIEKVAYSITYGANKQVQEIKAVPFN